jgi:hypothetical protein
MRGPRGQGQELPLARPAAHVCFATRDGRCGNPSDSEALGHRSIPMTVRYSHLSPDCVQDVVDKCSRRSSRRSRESN